MSDRWVVVTASLVVLAALLAPPVPVQLALAVFVSALVWRRPPLLALSLVLLVGGRADQQLGALAAPLPERVQGVAELVDDPERQAFGTSVLVGIDGRRYAASVPRELAAPLRRAGTGDRVLLEGRVRPLRGAPEGWVRSRHLAGRVSVAELERGPPPPVWYAAANAVRELYRSGAASFGDDLRPLYLGMVIGDDRELSDLRQFRFRAAGLSHLTAVSGQNVAFLTALASPVLSRLGRRARVGATVALLVGLVLVTRADPSVLRASVMAGLCAVALSVGRTATALRVLALTITILVVVDPMLVHALGFRLSVAATAGLVLLTGPIERRLSEVRLLGPGARRAVAVTLAAQVATLPLVLGLGPVSLVSVPANVLAVPAAGAVMMVGVVTGAIAGVVAEPVAEVLQLPVRLLVAWVDGVARSATSAPVGVLSAPQVVVAAAVVAAAVVCGRRARTGRAARVAVCVAVSVVAAMCWPWPPAVGVHDLGPGALVAVGRCGGIVVQVSSGATPVDVLELLHDHGRGRVDVLVVGPGPTERATAAVVSGQWPVRRRVQLPTTAPVVLAVGGAQVRADGSAATIGSSGAACRLSP